MIGNLVERYLLGVVDQRIDNTETEEDIEECY